MEEPVGPAGGARRNEVRVAAGSPDAKALEALPPELELEHADKLQDMQLKGTYARWLLWGMGIQVAVADLAFFLYGFWIGWDVSASVMSVWLTAAVVEVIAVALVVTRYLFPRRDGQL
jgi:hypothetical protein